MDPVIIKCPSCGKQMKVASKHLGRKIRCVGCQSVITAAAEPDEVAEAVDERPPRRSETRHKEDEDKIQDRPRRKSKRRDEEDDDDLKEDRVDSKRKGGKKRARGRVMIPALCLIFVGAFSILAHTLIIWQSFMKPVQLDENGQPQFAVHYTAQFVVLLMLLVATVMFNGAISMMRLSSYGMSMAAAIGAIAPCHIGCVLSAPFGIWALIVLRDPDVKRTFR